MSIKKTFVRNITFNQAGLFVNMAVGFFLLPFLWRQLGQVTYGLWIVIGVMVGYFALLDAGVSSSVGRFIAHYETKGDINGVNSTLTSSLGILSIVGLVVLLASGVLSLVFERIVGDVPAEILFDVRCAVLIAGLNMALAFPLQIFDGVLWGFQRFDLLNAVDIPIAVLRAVATVVWVRAGGGLIALAVVVLVCNILAGIAKAIISYRQEPRLKIARRFLTRQAARELFGFGFWNFLRSAAGRIIRQTDRLIVAKCLSIERVPPYHVAGQLAGFAGSLAASITGVITPEATRRNALADDEGRRRLLLRGTRICVILAVTLGTLFFALGRSFIIRYVGPEHADAVVILYVLGAGVTAGIAMGMTGPILVSMAKHRSMAYVGLCKAVVNLALSLLLVRRYGILGVAIGTVVPGLISSIIISPILVCRGSKTKLRQLLAEGFGPVLIASVPGFLLGWTLTFWTTISWPVLFIKGGLIVTAFAVVGWFVALSSTERGFIVQRISVVLRALLARMNCKRR